MTLLDEKTDFTSRMIAVEIEGHRTNVRLFDVELEALNAICEVRGISRNQFFTEALKCPERSEHNLTAKVRGAIVSYLLERWQAA